MVLRGRAGGDSKRTAIVLVGGEIQKGKKQATRKTPKEKKGYQNKHLRRGGKGRVKIVMGGGGVNVFFPEAIS